MFIFLDYYASTRTRGQGPEVVVNEETSNVREALYLERLKTLFLHLIFVSVSPIGVKVCGEGSQCLSLPNRYSRIPCMQTSRTPKKQVLLWWFHDWGRCCGVLRGERCGESVMCSLLIPCLPISGNTRLRTSRCTTWGTDAPPSVLFRGRWCMKPSSLSPLTDTQGGRRGTTRWSDYRTSTQ